MPNNSRARRLTKVGAPVEVLAAVLFSLLLCGVLRAQGPGGASQENAWMNAPPTSTGIAIGQKIPAFSVPDQNGKAQDFNSIKGSKGAAIYFMRSADW